MTTKIDKWAAEKCGVDISHGEYFDIKDPRCREIVRDKLDLITGKDGSRRTCYQDKRFSDTLSFGEDIEAAEIACITAIYEAEE